MSDASVGTVHHATWIMKILKENIGRTSLLSHPYMALMSVAAFMMRYAAFSLFFLLPWCYCSLIFVDICFLLFICFFCLLSLECPLMFLREPLGWNYFNWAHPIFRLPIQIILLLQIHSGVDVDNEWTNINTKMAPEWSNFSSNVKSEQVSSQVWPRPAFSSEKKFRMFNTKMLSFVCNYEVLYICFKGRSMSCWRKLELFHVILKPKQHYIPYSNPWQAW